jgi:8-amino-7-oxononanoate synthase
MEKMCGRICLVKDRESRQRFNDSNSIPEEHFVFVKSKEYLAFTKRNELIDKLGINPYFIQHEGVNKSITHISEQKFINYSSNNFLALSDHPAVVDAAKKSIEKFGTSVSASRLVSGERNIHRKLEQKIANWIGVEDAIVYVGAATTNVSTIGHLFSENDLVLYDEHSHDSLLQGIKLSGADSQAFVHNSWEDLELRLKKVRNRYEKVLVFIEGLYSMDGDTPDLPKFIEVKNKYNAILMVDECLSIGVLGKTGRGISECFDIDNSDVDIWMGGLSKAFASCGGYIAGNKELINYLKYTSPGFMFTTGMSPANAAAALAAINVLESSPEMISGLNAKIALFIRLAQENGLDTGKCSGATIIPIIIGDSMTCMKIYKALYAEGINVQPIIYPGVAENSARLRFSITASHTEEQIRLTIEKLARISSTLMQTSLA